ncbi:hypothetical protein NLM31_20170 [Bradyrhizobium sp. CCGUVB4N]|uniref:hypothetical protein n=1 Tax=Bradyrhizobium sp. CCGUVB4N TaxID=2949631 RepID=UPI0020B38105|nr:hypothetical protein [Bradyrhizobium sp. CCGUVB4N]MCP3382683.1 hypothetical protein [Bradyrhizobium sp. CCGUVB4N]
MTWWDDIVWKHKVHAPCATPGPAVSTPFISGNAAMMMLSKPYYAETSLKLP